MKNHLFISILLLLSMPVLSKGQNGEEDKSSQHYMVVYTVGAAWDTSMKAHEQKYFREHSSHLSQLREEGSIVLGGRYADKGMVLIKAVSFDKAKEMIGTDPAVKNEIFAAEIYHYSPFYKGCLD